MIIIYKYKYFFNLSIHMIFYLFAKFKIIVNIRNFANQKYIKIYNKIVRDLQNYRDKLSKIT